MAGAVSSKLIGVLKLTLEQLERTEELGHDSRAMRELRSSILRTIAELEIARLQHSRAAQTVCSSMKPRPPRLRERGHHTKMNAEPRLAFPSRVAKEPSQRIPFGHLLLGYSF